MRGTTTLSRGLFLSSTTSSLPLLLLLLLLIGIGFIGIVGVATAVDLPLSVQDSTYNSVDDTVPSQGTTLLVPSMLQDAVSKNLSTASFTAINLEFVGGLEITLPATDADWVYTTNTTNTTVILPALLVLIQNGRSWVNFSHPTLPPPSAFITISGGVLSSESNITIQGGVYNYTQSFINGAQGLFLRNSAVLAVVGGTFHTFYPCEAGGLGMHYLTSFIDTDTIDVTNGSLLHIANNAMLVENFTCRYSPSAIWVWGILGPSKVLSITLSSNIFVSYNIFVLSNISLVVEVIWGVVPSCLAFCSLPDTVINTSSTLLVTNNQLMGSYIGTSRFELYFISLSSKLLVSMGSTLLISNNDILMRDTVIFVSSLLVLSSSNVVVNSASEIVTSSNNITLLEVVLQEFGTLLWYFAKVGSVVVEGGSNLSISNNVWDINVTIVPGFNVPGLMLFLVSADAITQSIGVTISVSNNIMRTSYDGVECSLVDMFSGGILVSNSSALYIINNTLTLLGRAAIKLLYSSSSLILAYNSSLWVSDNDVWAASIFSYWGVSSPLTVSHHSAVYVHGNSLDTGRGVSVSTLWGATLFSTSNPTIDDYSIVSVLYNTYSWSADAVYFDLVTARGVMTISSSSSLLVSYNTITAFDVAETGQYISLRADDDSHSSVAVDTYSTIVVTGNHISITNTKTCDVSQVRLNRATVGAFSSIAVYNNSIVASDVVAGLGWSVYSVSILSLAMPSMSGTFSITNNTAMMADARLTALFMVVMKFAQYFSGSSSSSSGSIQLENNVVAISNVSVGNFNSNSLCELHVFVASTSFTIQSGGSLKVANNYIQTSNIPKFNTTIYPTSYICKAPGGLTINGRMEIVRNTAESGTLFFINTMLNSTGTLSLSYNNAVGDHNSNSTVVRIGSDGLMTPSQSTPFIIHTCRNYVNGTMCRRYNNYSVDDMNEGATCVVGSSEHLEISDCTPSSTVTLSSAAALPPHTLSPSPPDDSSSSSNPSTAYEPSTSSMLSSSSPGAVPVSSANTSSAPPPTSAASISSSSSPQTNSPLSSTDVSSSSAGSTAVGTTNRSCPVTPNSPCPYATSTLLSTSNITSSTISSQYPPGSSSNGGVSTPTTTNVGCMPGAPGLIVKVPFSTWSEGSPFFIYILLNRPLTKEFTSSFNDVGHAADTTMDSTNHLQYRHFLSSGVPEDMLLWIAIEISYTGVFTRSAKKSALSLPLPPSRFNCSFNSSISKNVSLEVVLEEGSSIPAVVTDALNVAVGVGIVTAVPSSIVRAGMMDTIVQLLRCEEFDPQEEVGLVNNPFMWAPGREELPYHRGSVMFAFILLGLLAVSMIIMILVSRVRSRSWKSAMEAVRIPSLALTFIVLVAEVGVSSAISMVYGGGDAKDITVCLLVLIPICAYISLYIYTTARSSRYVVSVPAQQQVDQAATDTKTTTDTNIANTTSSPPPNEEVLEQKGRIKRFLHYILEPTHDTVLVPKLVDANDDDDDTTSSITTAVSEGWFRCNFYFVTERRWALYGALELVGGTLTNMLEGIPITTSDRTVCIARPACIMVISSTLFALLLWKSPNSVRLQQWCGVFVMGGMTLTSTLALVNAISPSEDLITAIEYMGLVVVSISMILGLLEAVFLAVTYIPLIRRLLSLRPRGLQAVINTSNKHQQADHDDAFSGGLQVPMLAITADDLTPPPKTDGITSTTPNHHQLPPTTTTTDLISSSTPIPKMAQSTTTRLRNGCGTPNPYEKGRNTPQKRNYVDDDDLLLLAHDNDGIINDDTELPAIPSPIPLQPSQPPVVAPRKLTVGSSSFQHSTSAKTGGLGRITKHAIQENHSSSSASHHSPAPKETLHHAVPLDVDDILIRAIVADVDAFDKRKKEETSSSKANGIKQQHSDDDDDGFIL